MRQTSYDAYTHIKSKGLLGRLQMLVLTDVVECPCTTQGEATQRIISLMPKLREHSVSPRFAELVDKGVLSEGGQRRCNVTGREVLTYTFSGNLPVRPVKRLSENEILRNRIKDLEMVNAHLKGQIELYMKRPVQGLLFK